MAVLFTLYLCCFLEKVDSEMSLQADSISLDV